MEERRARRDKRFAFSLVIRITTTRSRLNESIVSEKEECKPNEHFQDKRIPTPSRTRLPIIPYTHLAVHS
ncbi:hypothetical protein HDV00_009701 [Rhizophlyctis rosea]|nr:hypothetical protein HDV00_009701 [Rhizophlyctis rosea]